MESGHLRTGDVARGRSDGYLTPPQGRQHEDLTVPDRGLHSHRSQASGIEWPRQREVGAARSEERGELGAESNSGGGGTTAGRSRGTRSPSFCPLGALRKSGLFVTPEKISGSSFGGGIHLMGGVSPSAHEPVRIAPMAGLPRAVTDTRHDYYTGGVGQSGERYDRGRVYDDYGKKTTSARAACVASDHGRGPSFPDPGTEGRDSNASRGSTTAAGGVRQGNDSRTPGVGHNNRSSNAERISAAESVRRGGPGVVGESGEFVGRSLSAGVARADGLTVERDAAELVSLGHDEWKKAWTPEGKIYYYNRRTRVSRWTLPPAATFVPNNAQPAGYRIFAPATPTVSAPHEGAGNTRDRERVAGALSRRVDPVGGTGKQASGGGSGGAGADGGLESGSGPRSTDPPSNAGVTPKGKSELAIDNRSRSAGVGGLQAATPDVWSAGAALESKTPRRRGGGGPMVSPSRSGERPTPLPQCTSPSSQKSFGRNGDDRGHPAAGGYSLGVRVLRADEGSPGPTEAAALRTARTRCESPGSARDTPSCDSGSAVGLSTKRYANNNASSKPSTLEGEGDAAAMQKFVVHKSGLLASSSAPTATTLTAAAAEAAGSETPAAPAHALRMSSCSPTEAAAFGHDYPITSTVVKMSTSGGKEDMQACRTHESGYENKTPSGPRTRIISGLGEDGADEKPGSAAREASSTRRKLGGGRARGGSDRFASALTALMPSADAACPNEALEGDDAVSLRLSSSSATAAATVASATAATAVPPSNDSIQQQEARAETTSQVARALRSKPAALMSTMTPGQQGSAAEPTDETTNGINMGAGSPMPANVEAALAAAEVSTRKGLEEEEEEKPGTSLVLESPVEEDKRGSSSQSGGEQLVIEGEPAEEDGEAWRLCGLGGAEIELSPPRSSSSSASVSGFVHSVRVDSGGRWDTSASPHPAVFRGVDVAGGRGTGGSATTVVSQLEDDRVLLFPGDVDGTSSGCKAEVSTARTIVERMEMKEGAEFSSARSPRALTKLPRGPVRRSDELTVQQPLSARMNARLLSFANDKEEPGSAPGTKATQAATAGTPATALARLLPENKARGQSLAEEPGSAAAAAAQEDTVDLARVSSGFGGARDNELPESSVLRHRVRRQLFSENSEARPLVFCPFCGEGALRPGGLLGHLQVCYVLARCRGSDTHRQVEAAIKAVALDNQEAPAAAGVDDGASFSFRSPREKKPLETSATLQQAPPALAPGHVGSGGGYVPDDAPSPSEAFSLGAEASGAAVSADVSGAGVGFSSSLVEGEEMERCGGCGRTFAPGRLHSHAKACQRVFLERRRPYDLKAMRARGTPLEFFQQPIGAPSSKDDGSACGRQGGDDDDGSSGVSRRRGGNAPFSVRGSSNRPWRVKKDGQGAPTPAVGTAKRLQCRESGLEAVKGRAHCPFCSGSIPRTKLSAHLLRCKRLRKTLGVRRAKGGSHRTGGACNGQKERGDNGDTCETKSTAPKVRCPHCSRGFSPSVAPTHISICARVENRPKSAPTKASRRDAGRVVLGLCTAPGFHPNANRAMQPQDKTRVMPPFY